MENPKVADHVYMDTVAEADHDGTWTCVDNGTLAITCGQCANDHVHRLTEPDEASDGSVISFGLLACCACFNEVAI